MSKVKSVFDFFVKNKYLVTIIFFVALIGFFDSNSLYNRYKLMQEEESLQEQVDYYTDMYNRDTQEYLDIQNDPNQVVRIAREKYYMQNPNEDVYIFANEETK